jgi:hypothetical protein
MKGRRDITSLAVVCTILTIAACASSGAGRGNNCPLLDRDSTFSATGAVYRDCAVDKKAVLATTNVRSQYRPATAGNNQCFSAEAEFVVDTLGHPEARTARILHATDPRYGEAVMELLPTLRFEPAVRGGERVRQVMTYKESLGTRVVVVPAGTVPLPPSQRGPRC